MKKKSNRARIRVQGDSNGSDPGQQVPIAPASNGNGNGDTTPQQTFLGKLQHLETLLDQALAIPALAAQQPSATMQQEAPTLTMAVTQEQDPDTMAMLLERTRKAAALADAIGEWLLQYTARSGEAAHVSAMAHGLVISRLVRNAPLHS